MHALNAAVMFRLVLGKAPAGTAWHAVSDQPSPSTRTRQALGWEPCQLSLLEDLENIQA